MSTIDTIGGRSRVSREAVGAKLTRLATIIVEKLAAMGDRRRSRRLLLEMSDSQLKDIGISRADAYREGSRPFWE